MSYNASTKSVNGPSGWSLIEAGIAGVADHVEIWAAPTSVGVGPHTWSFTSGTDYLGIVGYHVTGQNATSPENVNGHQNNTTSSLTQNGPSLTTTVAGCLPLTGFSTNGAITTWTASGSDAGTTASSKYHPCFAESAPIQSAAGTFQDSATTSSSTQSSAVTVMVAPAAASSLTASPSSLSFTDPKSAAQTTTISGGTSPYSIKTAPNAAIATDSLAGGTLTVTPVGAGSTSVVVQDSATPTAGTVTITITVDAAMSVSPTSLTFTDPKSAAQTSTISGGRSAYAVSSSNTAIATASVSGTTVTVTPVGAGSATITITDADTETATISVTVGAALAVSPTSMSFASPTAPAQSFTSNGGRANYAASSSNMAVATVSINASTGAGSVTPVAAGSATITITDADGETATIAVSVTAATSSPAGNFRGYWQVRIYDTTGKLVDLPQSDIESISINDQINGGSGTGTITFRRGFNQIGALGYGYAFLIWFWPYGSTQPVDPYYGGYLIDFDQKQLSTTGQVICYLEGDSKKLDAAIVTETIAPNVGNNPSLDAAAYCSHLLTTYQPPSFVAPAIPASMFNLLALQFDGTKLGACIDTVTKQGRDSSGLLFTWTVRTKHDLTRQVIIQKDQNPNVITSLTFKHLILESQLDQYTIQNKYRDIINTVAVYGGKDPVTGQQCYGVCQDANSAAPPPAGYGPIEDKISVPALLSNAACQSYGQTWLNLNAYPQAQGSARLLTPDPTIRAGTWVQIWEAPATPSAVASVKQVRVALVKVEIKGERIEQTISTTSPVPYLDEAIYRLGQHSAVQTAIANKPLPINTQQLYVRTGGYVTSTASSPAKVALAATDAVFPSGEVQAVAFPLTTLVDNSGGVNNGQGGDGYYTISLQSTGTYVITKGLEPANTSTQQNLCGVTVVSGVPFTVDKRTIGINAAAVATALDFNGNLLTSTFPGFVLMNSGAYEGYNRQTATRAYDVQALTLSLGEWLWMDWYSVPVNAGASPNGKGFGPCIKDGSGNEYWLDFSQGAGSLMYNNAAIGPALAANGSASATPHRMTLGMQYQAAGQFRIQGFMDGAPSDSPVIDYVHTGSAMAATVYPGFAIDPNTTVYHREIDITPGPTRFQQLDQAVVNNVLGCFGGMQLDASGYLRMPAVQDIYATQQALYMPPAGPSSVFIMSARFKSLGTSNDQVGLSFFTDAAAGGGTMQNGYLVQWQASGTALAIYKKTGGSWTSIGSVVASPVIDANWHTLRVIVQQQQTAGTLTIFAYADGVLCGTATDSSSPFLSGTCGPCTRGAQTPVLIDPASIEIDGGTKSYQEEHPIISGLLGLDGVSTVGTTAMNLVYNGDFSIYTPPTGVKSPNASAVRVNDTGYDGAKLLTPTGWTRNFDNAGAGEGRLGVTNLTGGPYGTFLILQDAASSGNSQFAAVCDAFPVSPGQPYLFMADVWLNLYTNVAGAQWYFRVLWYQPGTTDFSHNSATQVSYTDIVAGGTTSPSGLVKSVLTAPSNAAYCRIAFYHWGVTTAVWNLGIRNVRVYEAQQISSILNPQGSINPNTVPGITAQTYWSGQGGTYGAYEIIWNNLTIYFPDGTQVPIANGSLTWGAQTYTASSYYFYCYIQLSTMTVQGGIWGTSPPTAAQIASCYADGKVPIFTQLQMNAPTVGTHVYFGSIVTGGRLPN